MLDDDRAFWRETWRHRGSLRKRPGRRAVMTELWFRRRTIWFTLRGLCAAPAALIVEPILHGGWGIAVGSWAGTMFAIWWMQVERVGIRRPQNPEQVESAPAPTMHPPAPRGQPNGLRRSRW